MWHATTASISASPETRKHDRSIGVVQLDCIDDESALKSARRLVDSHDVELWHMDRPIARFDARSKQMCKK
jgi:hypothetical protein